MKLNMDFIEIAKNAKEASLKIAGVNVEIKNKALNAVANAIETHKAEIFDANKTDLKNAKILVDEGKLSKSTFNRLKLDENKMRDMIQGVRDIANLDDPIGKTLLKRELDKDLILEKVSCPI